MLAPDPPRTLKVSESREVGPREDRLGEEKNQQQLVINHTGVLEGAAVSSEMIKIPSLSGTK